MSDDLHPCWDLKWNLIWALCSVSLSSSNSVSKILKSRSFWSCLLYSLLYWICFTLFFDFAHNMTVLVHAVLNSASINFLVMQLKSKWRDWSSTKDLNSDLNFEQVSGVWLSTASLHSSGVAQREPALGSQSPVHCSENLSGTVQLPSEQCPGAGAVGPAG